MEWMMAKLMPLTCVVFSCACTAFGGPPGRSPAGSPDRYVRERGARERAAEQRLLDARLKLDEASRAAYEAAQATLEWKAARAEVDRARAAYAATADGLLKPLTADANYRRLVQRKRELDAALAPPDATVKRLLAAFEDRESNEPTSVLDDAAAERQEVAKMLAAKERPLLAANAKASAARADLTRAELKLTTLEEAFEHELLNDSSLTDMAEDLRASKKELHGEKGNPNLWLLDAEAPATRPSLSERRANDAPDFGTQPRGPPAAVPLRYCRSSRGQLGIDDDKSLTRHLNRGHGIDNRLCYLP
jgi:hypothetical protein